MLAVGAVLLWNVAFAGLWEMISFLSFCFPQDNEEFSTCSEPPVFWHGLLIWNGLLAVAAGLAWAVSAVVRVRSGRT